MVAERIYKCECCGKKSSNPNKILSCEARHLGLTVKEYQEYRRLLEVEKKASLVCERKRNKTTISDKNKAINAVLRFQKQHHVKI